MHRTAFEKAAAFVAQQGEPRLTLPTHCELVGPTQVSVLIGRHLVAVDQPRVLGGGGTAPTPEQYALAALGSSQAIAFRYWSERLGIPFDRLRVDVRGEIDLRGLVGVVHDARAGYSAVEMTVHLAGREPAPRYDLLARAAEDHCPVLDVFRKHVAVTTRVEHVDPPPRKQSIGGQAS